MMKQLSSKSSWRLSQVCLLLLISLLMLQLPGPLKANDESKTEIAYLASDLRIPFWSIMQRGIAYQAKVLGYGFKVYSAENDAKRELENVVDAFRRGVSGIIVSPIDSSSCVTILKLAAQANIPVVIADIGTESGEYVSYISSNNREGAYQIGQVLVEKMQSLGLNGRVGIIAIPQKRKNGRARTAGFMQALDEAGIGGADIYQQVDFSYQETYDFSLNLIRQTDDLKAIWLQGSDRYQAALDAIEAAGNSDEILLITFDAEPEFLQMIPQGKLVGAAMQQPYLMGEQAMINMDQYLHGNPVKKSHQLPVLAISSSNIGSNLPVIRRNVLGIAESDSH